MGSSSPFRKFVISSDRLLGRALLGYREPSIDEFSRPFGKETTHANAHCSPHQFTSKRSGQPASLSSSPFHTSDAGLTRSHHPQSRRARAPHQSQNCSRLGLLQPHGGQMATTLPRPGLHWPPRCHAPRAPENYRLAHSSAGDLGGELVAPRPEPHRHPMDPK